MPSNLQVLFLEQVAEVRALAFFLVLEVDEDVAAARVELLDRLGPLRDVLLRVALVAQPQVGVVGRRRSPASSASRCRRCTARGCDRAGARRPRRPATIRGGTRRRRRRAAAAAPRNSSSAARSFLKVGGSWNSSAPSRGPSSAAASQNARSGSATSRSLRSCVMRRGAFSVKRKSAGTCAAQPVDELRRGHPVEGVVDLDRREAVGVVGQHLRRRQDPADRSCPSIPGSCSRTCR